MPRSSLSLLVSLPIVFSAPAAFADLSATDVWEDWKAYIGGFGYEVEGREEASGNGLTISGVVITTGDDPAEGAAEIQMDRIVLTEQGDGTVAISLPAIMPLELSALNETGGVSRISMDYRHSELTILASGTPDALRYDYAADSVMLESTGLEINGEAMPGDSNKIAITMETISGHTDVTRDSLRRYDQTLTVGTLRYDLDARDPQTNASSDLSGQMQNVTFTGQSTQPLRQMDTDDLDALLVAGLQADGTFEFGANAMSIAVQVPEGTSEIALTSRAGRFGVAMGRDGLAYDTRQEETAVEIQSDQFPIPVSFTVAETAFSLMMPVRETDTAEDFSLGVTLDGFSMSDMLWQMFDPAGQLPRDPAKLALDMTGKAKLAFNVLDPAEAGSLTPDMVPGEVEKLDINRLEIAALGAQLDGKGGFVFDNSDAAAPKPSGAVDFTLTGANALIDTLVAMGMLPEQQAMGARMMMGMLAVPGDAPDTLTSKIEVNEMGHVMANGQRIR